MKSTNDLLAAHLAAGRSLTTAAELSGVSVRTARRQIQEPQFQRLVTGAKRELRRRVLGELARDLAGRPKAAGAGA
jgi:hypothetical protein